MQEPARFCSLQTALIPQGDGSQGLVSSNGNISENIRFIITFAL